MRNKQIYTRNLYILHILSSDKLQILLKKKNHKKRSKGEHITPVIKNNLSSGSGEKSLIFTAKLSETGTDTG